MKISSIRTIHLLLVLTFVGAFLRFYNLRGTLQFLGDQGRDAMIVRGMLVDKDPVFIGPVTSVGNMYLGPAYYYMMLPFSALTYPSPMGPVYAMALLGTLTIPLLYLVTKEMFDEKIALFATVIFTFSWTFIEYTRFSWNPNPAPFFSLIMIWATYRAWTKHPKYWLAVSIAFSFLIQLHYLTLLSLGSAGIIWLLSLMKVLQQTKQRSKKIQQFAVYTVAAIVIFIGSLTPLILFDLKHEFLNAQAFYNLIFGKEDQIRGANKLLTVIQETHGRSMQILFEVTLNQLRWLNTLLVMSVAAIVGWSIWQWKIAKKMHRGEAIVIVWLLIGIIGTSLYRSTVFSHYIAYLFPIASMMIAICLAKLWKYQLGKVLCVLFLTWFIVVNFQKYHYKSLGWTIDNMKNVSDQILAKVQPGEKYNIVLLAAHGDIDGMNYRYFLTASSKPPLTKEHFGEVDTLFIINEDHVLKKVTDSPIYEIVVFPNKEVNEVFQIEKGPEVTVLRR